jgi:hypothetical protein
MHGTIQMKYIMQEGIYPSERLLMILSYFLLLLVVLFGLYRRPIPPSIDHVALGMVGTNTPEEPDPEMVRCVPKAWVIPSKFEPRMIWDDSGAGGKKGSVWAINSMQLMGVTPGHEKPQGAFFEMWSKRFMAIEAVSHNLLIQSTDPIYSFNQQTTCILIRIMSLQNS